VTPVKAPELCTVKGGEICKPKKKSKYSNVKVVVDNITFDSIREAERYKVLKMLLAGGAISDLRLQVCYELNPGGTHSLKYIADFVYKEGDVEVVEDSKGARTAVYKKKARLMKKVRGIIIKEV
jgi:hypothetical protein